MQIDLSGHRAVVGGASQGIGRATAVLLAKLGCSIVAVSRSADKLASLIEELEGRGHVMIPHDISDTKGLRLRLGMAIEEKGPIDIMICNSGGPKGGPLAEAQELEFLSGIQQHLLANQALLQTCLPGMKQKQWGRIINIISTSVKSPIENLGVSNTVRGAVANWSKTLARELGPSNITVNNVLPGYTQTPRLTALLEGFANKQGVSVDEAEKIWKQRVPLRRFASPEETAAGIAFLCSDHAAYINGINLPIDGGRLDCL